MPTCQHCGNTFETVADLPFHGAGLCTPKTMSTPTQDTSKQTVPELAKQAAMQLIHGGLFSKMQGQLPTVDAVAEIIARETDLAYFIAIRDKACAVPAPSLMTAAPDLLEALQVVADEVECYCMPELKNRGICGSCQARAAIAKAKGQA